MDHKASYIMTRVTVAAEVTHKGQIGVNHINISSHGGYGWWVPTRRFLSEKLEGSKLEEWGRKAFS